MLAISLYWFAVEQQTNTFRNQKTQSIYSKFSLEENNFTPCFQNLQEVTWKLQNPKSAQKT